MQAGGAVRSAEPAVRRASARRPSRLQAVPSLGVPAAEREANPLYAELDRQLDKYDFRFRVGEKVTGTILLVVNNGLYVDIGAKSAAFCPLAECAMGPKARVRGASPWPPVAVRLAG